MVGSCFVSKSHPFHHGNSPPCRTVASCFSCDPFLALNTKQAARLLTKVTESICRYWLKIQLHYLRVGKLTSSHLAQPSWRVGPCTGWCRSTVQGWGKLTIQCDGSEHWWVSSGPPLFSLLLEWKGHSLSISRSIDMFTGNRWRCLQPMFHFQYWLKTV